MAEIRLTAQQQCAVDDRGGALLVSAAAGSGKTKVLVDRVLKRVCDPADPQDINRFLIITYTKAAAAELRGKIAEAISAALAKRPGDRHLQRQLSRIYLAKISTVHAFCADILREYAHELGLYPDFRIAEETESAEWKQQAMERTLEAAYEHLDADDARRAFLDQLGAGRDDRMAATILMQAYNSVQCHPDPAEWIADCLRQLDVSACRDMADTVWGDYLMRDFVRLLDEQIESMERGLIRLHENEQVEEKYAPAFRNNLEQLRFLRAARSWDELRDRRITDFGRLAGVKGADKTELERFKRPRENCKDRVKKAQAVFSMTSDEALEELRQSAPVIRGLFSLAADFTANYQAIKQRRRALDFSDLEHEALRLLYQRGTGEPTPAAMELRDRFCEIMVDEYQDSNRVQDRIFAAVSRDGENLFMVGDVKQSIYRFRLADPGIFVEKYKRYQDAAAASPGQPRRVTLSKNFRSVPRILSAVNDVFGLCMSEEVGDIRYGPDERLYPGAQPPVLPGHAVELHCLDTADAEDSVRTSEARLAAVRIAQLLRGGTLVREGDELRPARPSDVVILLRSARSQAPYYLRALAEEGIDAVSDRDDDILQTTEVSVLLSYLQILDNPHQDVPLLSVLLSPVYGYGADEVAQIRANSREGDVYDALVKYSGQHETFSAFLDDFGALRAIAHRYSADVIVRAVCQRTGLRDVFCAMEDGDQRLENLQTIYLMAAGFDPDGPGALHDFLCRLEQQRDRGVAGAGLNVKDAVHIMSIHKSKGLEFPVVVVAGLATGFNTQDDVQPVLIHPELGTGCDMVDIARRIKYPSVAKRAVQAKQRAERLSEELRVLYVALTRPKDRLIMTYASARLGSKLRAIADRLAPDGPVSLSRDANCLGHWVLMAAMRRGEAGELFSLGGQPDEAVVTDDPWLIRLWTPDMLPPAAAAAATDANPPERLSGEAAELVRFRYPNLAATAAPAKLTATQFKGRQLDRESAEDARPEKSGKQPLRQPIFLRGKRPLSSTEQGTAVHLAMQYIRYESCTDEAAVADELERLVSEGFLLPEQADCVLPGKIMALFRSALGRRIMAAPEVIREFKFSILADGAILEPALSGERIMLQGVTDCCLLEPDGLCVIDYKTDRVSPGGERERAEFYRGQLNAYADALSRIFERPVKEKILYFFATDTAVTLD